MEEHTQLEEQSQGLMSTNCSETQSGEILTLQIRKWSLREGK